MACAANCSGTNTNVSNEINAGNSVNPELEQESVVILSVICALASFCGSFGNVLVILAVLKSPSLRSVSDFIISSLAFSDLTVCFIYLPLSIYRYNHFTSQATQQGSYFSITKSFFGHCSLIASVTNMFAVTVDRVIAIRFPFKYLGIMTSNTAYVIITIVWLISLTAGVLYAQEMFSKIILRGYCIVLMLSTMSLYAYIFAIAKTQENKVQAMNTSTTRQLKTNKKAAKTIFIVVGIYALCWLPLLLLPAIVNPSKKPLLFKKVLPWVQVALASNSALNPYVYCMRNHKYRRQFGKILRINLSEDFNSNSASNGQQ